MSGLAHQIFPFGPFFLLKFFSHLGSLTFIRIGIYVCVKNNYTDDHLVLFCTSGVNLIKLLQVCKLHL